MRILTTGDWHLGRREEITQSIEQIIGIAVSEKPDLVAIIGDIFDRVSDPRSRVVFSDAVSRLSDVAPVLIVKGNHDAKSDLLIFEKMGAKCPVRVYEQPGIYRFQLSDGRNGALHLVPWVNKAAWVSEHGVGAARESDAIISQALGKHLALSVMLAACDVNILVGHLMVSGAKFGKGQPVVSSGIELSTGDIAVAGFNAAVLGHIHLRQHLLDGPYYYNGSIAPLDFGETSAKYISILDTDTLQVEWIGLKTIPMIEVIIDFTQPGPVVVKDVDELRGAMVRVYARVSVADDMARAESVVRRTLEPYGCLDIKVYPQIMATAEIRSDQIALSKSNADKLRAYWSVTGEPDEETKNDMLVKLAQIEEQMAAGV